MDKSGLLLSLAQANERILKGEELVARQRVIVDLLEREGQPSQASRMMLAEFEAMLAGATAARDQLVAELQEQPD